jgi:2-hydroxy-6-oxonona-2,4-dienedioate hydrolase
MQTRRIVLPAAAAATLGLLAAYRAYRQDIRKAHRRISSGSSIIHTKLGIIEYADIGEGEPLLVVHGAGGGFDQALAFAANLNQARFRCIFVSRFGYLRTPLPADASPEAQADQYASLLDSLGISQSAILGVSAGAPSALQFAIRHPRRCSALLLLVPATFAPDGQGISPASPSLTRLLAGTILGSDFAFWLMIHLARRTVIENILGTPFGVVERATPAERARLQTMLMNILPVSRRQAGLRNDAAVISQLKPFDLARIDAPAMLISLEDDRYGTFPGAQYTAGQIRNARFIGFREGGHLWVGHNDEVSAAVRDFLQSATRHRAPLAGEPNAVQSPVPVVD